LAKSMRKGNKSGGREMLKLDKWQVLKDVSLRLPVLRKNKNFRAGA
jgi:hypothetical protein